jgi:hypothetical protein
MNSRRKDDQVDREGGETAVIADKTVTLNHSNLPLIFGWLVQTDREKIQRISTDVFHIGSSEAADLILGADSLKDFHCSIYFVNDHFEINDNNTRTGTKVNQISVKRQELRDDDILTLGEFSLLFKCFRGGANG